MAPEDSCVHDMLVLIRWPGRNVTVPLSQPVPLDADRATIKAVGDRHYWLAQACCSGFKCR